MMSNKAQPVLSVSSGIDSDEQTHLIDQDDRDPKLRSKAKKAGLARAARTVWTRKWHMLFFTVFVATSVPMLCMARDGVFSAGLLVICSATMLAWVMFQGIERERRRTTDQNEQVCSQEV
jgi:hypothetical protein